MRRKILGIYGLSKLTLLGFAAVVFVDLYSLKRQIEEGQAVADLRRAALEMRRDEKNLFLYSDVEGLNHFLTESAEARHLLDVYRNTLVEIGGEKRIDRMMEVLNGYEAALLAYPGISPAQKVAEQKRIRALGGQLYDTTRTLLVSERARLSKGMLDAGRLLFMALVIVVLLEIAGGWYLLRSVVRPLRKLEEGLVAIDQGRARTLPLPSGDREIRSFVGAFNTMLKHMRHQQDLARRNEKAAALGVLVSGVAHELNNPLSNISTSAQLLIEEGCDADQESRERWLAQIDGETERARRIVRRLLDSVRQPQTQRGLQEAGELIQAAVQLVHSQIPDAVKLCVQVSEDIHLPVDRERMLQVFINLIKNAADAGACHIELSAKTAYWDSDRADDGLMVGDPAILLQSPRALCLTVADDGPGIPETMRERMFDPFVTSKGQGEGTGLGLYLVEEIISEHQGVIVVEQAVSGGAQFSIWLPLAEERT